MIFGLDEAGRGPWAGPLLVAGVLVGDDFSLPGLNDSKQLDQATREALYHQICQSADAITISWSSAAQIDSLGLGACLASSFNKCFADLYCNYLDIDIIIDGKCDYINKPNSKAVVKADAIYPAVMAASVVAKHLRDQYMIMQDRLYPGYGLVDNKGYGTAHHIQAIHDLGAVKGLHRLSIKPLKDVSFL